MGFMAAEMLIKGKTNRIICTKDGKEVVYRIREVDPDTQTAIKEGEKLGAYTASYVRATDGAITITNSYVAEKINVSGSKTWNDANNQDGKRPQSITINLLADGTEVNQKVVTAANGWTWNFIDLDKYKAGREIVYTITEDAVANYKTSLGGYNITNTYVPETIKVSGTKIWDDAGVACVIKSSLIKQLSPFRRMRQQSE